MPTLSELAKTQQTTTVGSAPSGSIGSAGGTNIQATKQVDNSAGLVKDIGKMLGGLVEEHQQASEYAGKRVGTDNLVEYNNKLNQLNAMYNDKEKLTSADMVEKNRLEQGLYEEHMQKGHFGDNALANQSFKDTYATPATDILFKKRGQNNNNRVKLFQDETKLKVSDEVESIGAWISDEHLKTFKQEYREAGLDPKGVTDLYITSATLSVEKELNDNYNTYYDEGGNVKTGEADKLVDYMFRLVSETDGEAVLGGVAKVRENAKNFVDAKAGKASTEYFGKAKNLGRSNIYDGIPYIDEQGVQHKYAATAQEYEATVRENYPLLNDKDFETVMNMYNIDKATSDYQNYIVTDWVERYDDKVGNVVKNNLAVDPTTVDTLVEEFKAIQSSPLYSPSAKLNAKTKFVDVKVMQDNNAAIALEMTALLNGNMKPLQAKNNLENGTLREGYVVEPVQYQAMYKQAITNTTTSIEKLDMKSKNSSSAFTSQLVSLDKLQTTLDGGKPKLFAKFDGLVKDRTQLYNMDANDIAQFAGYMDYQFTANPKEYEAYKNNVAQLQSFINEQNRDTETPQATKDMTLKTFARSALQWQNTPKNAQTMWNTAIEKMQTGEGYIGTIFNTDGAGNLNNVMQSVFMGEYTEEGLDKFVGSYDFYEVEGAKGLVDNQRVPLPKSMTKTGMDFLLAEYTKAEGITANDVTLTAFRSVSETGSINIGYNVMYKSINGFTKNLGQVTSDAYNKLKPVRK